MIQTINQIQKEERRFINIMTHQQISADYEAASLGSSGAEEENSSKSLRSSAEILRTMSAPSTRLMEYLKRLIFSRHGIILLHLLI